MKNKNLYRDDPELRQEIKFDSAFDSALEVFTFEVSPWATIVGLGVCYECHRETGEKRPIHADLPELGLKKGTFIYPKPIR